MIGPRGRIATSRVIGLVLIVLGTLFLLSRTFGIDLWDQVWPLFVIVPGLFFFAAMVVGGPSAGPLAIPGSIITTIGLVLLYQSAFDRWESWAYAWALVFPTSIGVGLAIQGLWSDQPRVRRAGAGIATFGLVLFAVFAVFFELLLNISGFVDESVAQNVWPILLIAAGLYLLLARGRRFSRR